MNQEKKPDYFIVKSAVIHKPGTPGPQQFRYEVFCDGHKIGQRISPRTYVACIGIAGRDNVTGNTTHGVCNWFGREDLIGKGDSKHLLGKPTTFVARLLTTEEGTCM